MKQQKKTTRSAVQGVVTVSYTHLIRRSFV